MASGLAVIGGFIVTSLLSVFVLQSGINRSHGSTESMDNMKNAFRELLQKVKSDLNFE